MNEKNVIYLRIDVDTEIGTKYGIQNIVDVLNKYRINGTFFLSVGPDNMGRSIKRIFSRNFFKKILRTNAVSNYGIRTMINGILIPGPILGKKYKDIMFNIDKNCFEVGIHCYDHAWWQNNINSASKKQVYKQMNLAWDIFSDIFGFLPMSFASPGWVANKYAIEYCIEHDISYISDCRGENVCIFKPYNILQIPTTLPTLDELLGYNELSDIYDTYMHLIRNNAINGIINVLTVHAELEGIRYLSFFEKLIKKLTENGYDITSLNKVEIPNNRYGILEQKEIHGRPGIVSTVRVVYN